VLVFALVLALLVGAALQGSALQARSAAWEWQAARARNFAETALELLLRRAAQRWPDGGVHCDADRYCPADFPAVGSLLARTPAGWAVTAELAPPSVRALPSGTAADASSARAYRWRVLEARVRIDGPVPVSLAAGLFLPAVAGEGEAP
jgi:Tfp pilus assembly protein PilX